MMRGGIVSLCCLLPFLLLGQDAVDTTLKLKTFVFQQELIKPGRSFKQEELDTMALDPLNGINLDDQLQRNSDLFIKDYGTGALSTVSLRGLGASHTQVFWNGVPMNSKMNGTTDLSLIPGSFFQEIDINYGASSMIDGAGGLGGSVQLKSAPRLQNDGLALDLFQRFDQNANSTSALGIEFRKKRFLSKTDVSLQYNQNEIDYYIPGSLDSRITQTGAQNQLFGLQQKLLFAINDNQRVELDVLLTNADRNLPPHLLAVDSNETQFDNRIIGSLMYRLNTKHVYWMFQSSLSASALEYENRNLDLIAPSMETSSWNQVRAKYRLGKKIELESALIGSYTQATNDEYTQNGQDLSLQMLHQIEYEFAQNWQLTGIMKTWSQNGDFIPLQPSLGISTFQFKKRLKLYLNGGLHYAFPTLNDRFWARGGNPDLLPEEGINVDMGGLYKLPLTERHKIVFGLSSHWSNTDQWINWSPDTNGNFVARNIQNVTAKGAEARIGYAFSNEKSGLNLDVRYNLNSTSDENGNSLAYVPLHRVLFVAKVRYKNIRIRYNHQFIDKRFILPAELGFLPDYFTANLGISYSWRWGSESSPQSFTSAFNVNNLYDEAYQNIANRPMPARFLSVTVKYQLR